MGLTSKRGGVREASSTESTLMEVSMSARPIHLATDTGERLGGDESRPLLAALTAAADVTLIWPLMNISMMLPAGLVDNGDRPKQMEDPGVFESSSSERSVSPLCRHDRSESTGLQQITALPGRFGGVTAGVSTEEKLEAAKTAEGEGLLSKLTPSCVVSSGWEEHSSFSAAAADASSLFWNVGVLPHWISFLQLSIGILTQEW